MERAFNSGTRRKARGGASLRRLAAPMAAVLGCLQPGIDPVFLTLLTHATGVPLASHGWIVGATQGGSAVGALLVWLYGAHLPRRSGMAAAVLALVCALLTPLASGLAVVLALRAVFGLAMGAIYARAMAAFAARRPTGAYGAVLLSQLLCATVLSLVLPDVARRGGADLALLGLAVVPGLAALAMPFVECAAVSAPVERGATSRAGWAMALATFWFICATMMVWSLSGALAMAAGLGEGVIGKAVAVGSLAGAITALGVMRERRVVPMPVTAVLVGLALLAPLVMTRPGAALDFMLAIVLLNIGSTAIIIRCSGIATGLGLNTRFRVFVAATHSLGMSAGPALGSGAMWVWPGSGLLLAAGFAVVAGIAAVSVAYWRMPAR